ncbi:MAG: hypothetical protein JW769_03980 [Parachlamydiales bacterium]|nr:hypothetical protein [Parachlamydiales bacterium]
MQITNTTHFTSLTKALSLQPLEIIHMIEKANLRGRGGANFPTATKWKFALNAPRSEKHLICNFDEGEPGTFKDKFIADNNPDLLIEGIAIASLAIKAQKAFIYLRGEYHYLQQSLEAVIQKYQKQLDLIPLTISIVLGSGAYICGDETSIMNSIENIRPEPRTKPPFPAQKGLYGTPTCINNVETLANVPLIIAGGWKDLRLFSVSGCVQFPKIYEFPENITAKELFDVAKPTAPLKALFFGCAGGCVRYDPSLRLGIEELKKHGAMFGSATIIAVDIHQSIPKLCRNILQFFVHESCGKCTPCREGTTRALEMLEKIIYRQHTKKDIDLLLSLCDCMTETSFCGLGQTAGIPIKTAIKNFQQEF